MEISTMLNEQTHYFYGHVQELYWYWYCYRLKYQRVYLLDLNGFYKPTHSNHKSSMVVSPLIKHVWRILRMLIYYIYIHTGNICYFSLVLVPWLIQLDSTIQIRCCVRNSELLCPHVIAQFTTMGRWEDDKPRHVLGSLFSDKASFWANSVVYLYQYTMNYEWYDDIKHSLWANIMNIEYWTINTYPWRLK